MSHITPKDWKEFQQYRDRKPPWIKLHRNLLDNYDFACLPDASRALAPLMWLLASEFDGGAITLMPNEIAFRLRCNVEYFIEAMKPLIVKCFFSSDIKLLATSLQTASPERESESELESQEQSETERSAERRAPNVKQAMKEKIDELPFGSPAVTKPKKTKGTRLSEDWKLSQRNTDDARKEGLKEVLMAQEAKKFRNYWTALAGAKAVKVNWDSTWHNWCLKVAQDKGLTPEAPVEIIVTNKTDLEWQKILGHYARTNNWLTQWGPKPGDKGCLVPPNLMRDGDDLYDT